METAIVPFGFFRPIKSNRHNESKGISVYIHIPFCEKKCHYCDFLSFSIDSTCAKDIDDYTLALANEIKFDLTQRKDFYIDTVFFGGGTPSLLNLKQLDLLLDTVQKNGDLRNDAEITIEANPGTVCKEKLKGLKTAGFNRISFGLQSNNNRLLKLIGRIHDCETFEKNFILARKAGFDNINVDLMFALPEQTVEEWNNAVDFVISTGADHVSTYCLTLEEGAPLCVLVSKGMFVPDEDKQLQMYHNAINTLKKAGYQHYEISNFAKPGKGSRHNMAYWRCKEYVGFGLGASSYINSIRFRNENDFGKYVKSKGVPQKYEICHLTENDKISEFMFLGLRMMEGVSELDFENRFGLDIWEVYGSVLDRLIKNCLVEHNNGMIRLSSRGIDISNYVFSELLL